MTVSTADNREQYDGNDSATEFDYTFKIFKADDLTVILTASDDTETTLVRGSDYSVDGVGDEGGGTVTYPLSGDPLATGETLTILREIPVVQETDLRNQGAYYPETIEDELDRSRMIDQQQEEQLGRTLSRTRASDYFDARGRRIADVGNAVEDQDAYTKGQADARFANDVITKTGGEWDAKGLHIKSLTTPAAPADNDAMNFLAVYKYFTSLESGELGDTSKVNTSTGQEQPLAEALDQRVIYVGSVAELEALSLPVGMSVYLTEEGRAGEGVIESGTHVADPQKGVFIDLDNGNYWVRQFGQTVTSYPTVKSCWFGDAPGTSESKTGYIQAAHDFIKSFSSQENPGEVLVSPPGARRIDTQLYIDASKVSVDFGGSELDASNFTAGTAIKVGGSATGVANQPRDQIKNSIKRLTLKGPGGIDYTKVEAGLAGYAGPSVVGISFGGVDESPSRITLESVWVTDFERLYEFLDNTYLMKFYSCGALRGSVAISVPPETLNAGENNSLYGFLVSNVDMVFDINSEQNFSLYAPSFDDNRAIAFINAATLIQVHGGHIEQPNSDHPWTQGMLWQGENINAPLYRSIGSAGSANMFILNGVRFVYNPTTGPVYLAYDKNTIEEDPACFRFYECLLNDNIPCSSGYLLGSDGAAMIGERNGGVGSAFPGPELFGAPVVANAGGSFEDASAPLYVSILQGSNIMDRHNSDNITISKNIGGGVAGSDCVEIARPSGGTVLAILFVPIRPGDWVSAESKIKTTDGSQVSANYGFSSLQYDEKNIPVREKTITLFSKAVTSTAFEDVQYKKGGTAPSWATHLALTLSLNNLTIGSSALIDDFHVYRM